MRSSDGILRDKPSLTQTEPDKPLSRTVADLLPYLRRYARALTRRGFVPFPIDVPEYINLTEEEQADKIAAVFM